MYFRARFPHSNPWIQFWFMTGLTSLQKHRIHFLCDRKKLDSNHGPRLPMSVAWLHAYKQKYEHLPSTHLEARTKLVCSKVGHAHHHSQQDKNNVNWERWGAGRKNDKQFNTLPAPAPGGRQLPREKLKQFLFGWEQLRWKAGQNNGVRSPIKSITTYNSHLMNEEGELWI